MNRQAFYEDFLLLYLFIYGSINTNNLHCLFNNDDQAAHNIISNRNESTNYIKRGLLKYDENTQNISITTNGINEVIYRYTGPR